MYAADHDRLFGAAAPAAPVRLENVDYEALMARGRVLRARQFARLFDQVVAGLKRLYA
jgi:hypothetical protein